MSFASVADTALAPSPPAIAVEAVRLTKTYRPMASIRYWLARGLGRPVPANNGTGHPEEVRALSEVTFAIRRGEAFGVIGRNGAGKSTLLQILAGTLRPSSGECRIAGRVTALLELGSGFNPEFTGRENIYLAGSILGVSRQEMDRRFEDIIRFADIG